MRKQGGQLAALQDVGEMREMPRRAVEVGDLRSLRRGEGMACMGCEDRSMASWGTMVGRSVEPRTYVDITVWRFPIGDM